MELTGTIDVFGDQGMEGDVMWAFFLDGKQGWDKLFPLDRNDRLIVYDEQGRVLFDGKITMPYQGTPANCAAWGREMIGGGRDLAGLRARLIRDDPNPER
jgi:hypothetical protein